LIPAGQGGGKSHVREICHSDINARHRLFDAGTEANQVGAAGPDQPLRQAAANTGAREGAAIVRSFDDPVWEYPPIVDLLRVTITPLP